jgi:predicted RNA-binding Zn-ribbon protein involved in translation (DUF1610 family)
MKPRKMPKIIPRKDAISECTKCGYNRFRTVKKGVSFACRWCGEVRGDVINAEIMD